MLKWKALLTAGLMVVLASVGSDEAAAGKGHGPSGKGGFSGGMNRMQVAPRVSTPVRMNNGIGHTVVNTPKIQKFPAVTHVPQGKFGQAVTLPKPNFKPQVPQQTLPKPNFSNGTLGRIDPAKIGQLPKLPTVPNLNPQIKPIRNPTGNMPILPGNFPNLAKAGQGPSNPIFTSAKKGLPQALTHKGFGFCGTTPSCGTPWGGGWGGKFGCGYWGWGLGWNCGNWGFGSPCGYWPGYFNPCCNPVYYTPACYYTPVYFTTPAVSVAPSTTVVVNDMTVPPAPTSAELKEIDLAIKDVRVVEAATATQGALYRITILNQGPTNLDMPTRVAALGMKDAQPSADMPRAMETLSALKVGQTADVNVRMPKEANELPRLLIAVEIPESFKDTDEQNNVAAGEVAQLASLNAARN